MNWKKTYSAIAAVLMFMTGCAKDSMFVEDKLTGDNRIVFAANSSRPITKAGLEYERFDVGTKYLLYCIENSDSYDWSAGNMIMNDVTGIEAENHLIDYGEDIFFEDRNLDFYGVTLSETSALPERTVESVGNAPQFGLSLSDTRTGEFPDLMYSNNLKRCNYTMGLLDMNFTHALSKVEFEVVRQDDDTLRDIRLKEISILNTYRDGVLDIVSGTWTLGSAITEESKARLFYSAADGGMNIQTEPIMVGDGSGNDATMLILPNDGQAQEIALNIRVVLAMPDGSERTELYPLYVSDTAEGSNAEGSKPFIFTKNHVYKLTIVVVTNGVKIITVTPQVFDWIEKEPELYMGQPVTFGGLMWMDRNLGATSADCAKNWRATRGFYYQFGRNIPYIFDDEKFIGRTSDTPEFMPHRTTQLNLGYQYFFTYNEKGERIYGAVQGGTRTNHQRYFVDTLNINGVRTGWVQTGSGWEWQGSYFTNYRHEAVGHYNNDVAPGTYSDGTYWHTDQVGKDGVAWYSNPQTEPRTPVWRGKNVTVSNIAINPGDEGIYHFIFDVRFYHDYLQSGAWCVEDCLNCYNEDGSNNDSQWKGSAASSSLTYGDWLRSGCWESRTEAVDAVNNLWADASGKPLPENHPCPKGWRIPTKEEFANIFPDHTIEYSWASKGEVMYVLGETQGAVVPEHKEAAIYGVDHNGEKAIYLIKRKGLDDCYRLRLRWVESNTKRSEYYKLKNTDDDFYMQYLEISRYPGNAEMSFDKYFNSSVGEIMTTNESLLTMDEHTTVRKMTAAQLRDETTFYSDFDWDNPTEKMEIPVCGFIYTALGVDGMYDDGRMTILRCVDHSADYDLMKKVGWQGLTYTAGSYPRNEALNWCAYIRTDRNTGIFSGSRKALGCQIRCVRDVNATE